jgi:hypothetical protein
MAVNVTQNHYRFLRYDNTWAEWQAGPYSQESLHAFQVLPGRRDCIDCHMPAGRTGTVDHTCPMGPSLAAPNRNLRVEVFAIRRIQAGSSGSERLDAPLENQPVTVSPGAHVVIDVLVENRGVGHVFPAATESGENVWLEFEVRDAAGHALASPPSPHRYGQLALDRYGKALTSRRTWRTMVSRCRQS